MTTHPPITFILDEPIAQDALERFAALAETIPPDVRAQLLMHFRFDQAEQFYRGLCAGMATARQIVEGVPADRVIPLLDALIVLAAGQVVGVDEFRQEEVEERP